MIKEGINKGVIELEDLIKWLESVRETEGNLKVTINGSFAYDLEDNITIEPFEDIVDISYNL